MSSTHNPGRVAGSWYLLLVVIAPLRLMYIPSKLFVPGNAAATVGNIAAHEWLFRFGIVATWSRGGLDLLNDAGALMLVRGADFLSVFDKPQRDALAMVFLRLHQQEVVTAEILWVLWLLPLAMLVCGSRFLPRFLGVWLIINGFAYVILSFTGCYYRNTTKTCLSSPDPPFWGSWRSCCGA